MARKRHHKKRHHRRRRSMSGMGAGMGNVLSILAGAVVGKIAVNKLASTMDPKIQAGAQIAAGFVANRFVKNAFVKGMGTGMIVAGGMQALTTFGVISAISGIGAGVEVDYMSGDDDMAGLGYDDEMNGSSTIETIAGGFNGFAGSSTIETLAGDEDY